MRVVRLALGRFPQCGPQSGEGERLDLVPDLSFAQLGQRLSGSAPDVTVVPAMPDSDASDRAMVTSWIKDTASDGLLLSVCAGAQLVAETGLLDGR
ncbi:hypothetical protein AB0J69_57570, partial [Nonomuraea sp. NPDC049709]